MDTFLPLCGAIFLAAGLVKGVSGMGLPTLSMALLTVMTALPPSGAAALMVLPALLTNVAQCLGGHGRMLLRRLWPMWLALVVGTLMSPLASPGMARLAQLTTGVVLLAYGAWGLTKPRLPSFERWPRLAAAIAGALSGLLAAGTGVFVMPMVPFLQTLKLEKPALVQAMGISFTLGTVALAARFGHGLPAEVSPASVAMATAAAFLGLSLGTRLLGRLLPATFQRILYAVFLALGALMLVNG